MNIDIMIKNARNEHIGAMSKQLYSALARQLDVYIKLRNTANRQQADSSYAKGVIDGLLIAQEIIKAYEVLEKR